jgi:methylmalonyl-CoA mutase
VLGAIELQYQRSRIQEESLHYELKKDSGELPIVGVNAYLDPEEGKSSGEPAEIELARATAEEKDQQIRRLAAFHETHRAESGAALARLKAVATTEEGNVFAELMSAVRVASLGQITNALYEVGGRYRRAL